MDNVFRLIALKVKQIPTGGMHLKTKVSLGESVQEYDVTNLE